jgi:hypothetical protein
LNFREFAEADASLVRDHYQAMTMALQSTDCFDCSGQELEFFPPFYIIARKLSVDDPIAVEKNGECARYHDATKC